MNGASTDNTGVAGVPVSDNAPSWWRRHWLTVVTIGLMVAALYVLGLVPELPAVLAFVFGGALLATIDWKVKRLPSKIIYYTLAGVGAGLVVAAVGERDVEPLAWALAGGLLYANGFLLIWLFSEKYAGLTMIGLGDVRLAAVLGLLLGWYGMPALIAGVIVGHALALCLVIGLSVARRQLQLRVPFGPALIAGTYIVVLAVG